VHDDSDDCDEALVQEIIKSATREENNKRIAQFFHKKSITVTN